MSAFKLKLTSTLALLLKKLYIRTVKYQVLSTSLNIKVLLKLTIGRIFLTFLIFIYKNGNLIIFLYGISGFCRF